MKVTWHDAGRDPSMPAKPEYPEGIDLDISKGADRTCTATLPYPAKRCGSYVIVCERCWQRVMCTTAGRADDPRSIKMACKDIA